MKDGSEIAGLPKEGFLKVGSQKTESLTGQQRTALIRKGNELFNAGEVERAKRIFLTTGYADGIIRVGDAYYKKRDPLEAFRMYWMAPAPDKRAEMIEKMALIVHRWLKEDGSRPQ
jgi:hypothetical protein